MTNEDIAKLQETYDRAKSNTKRLDKVEKKLDDNEQMLISIASLSQKQEDMESDVKEIKKDVKELSGKAGRRWDSIVDKVLLGIVAALVAYALRQIGIS